MSAIVTAMAGLATASAETRVALVVGNGGYKHTAVLPNPPNDALDMVAALKSTGFDVIQAIDADKRGMDGALRAFTEKLAGADVALFFYAGHGLQVGAQNYLVPTDARLSQERDLEFEAVRVDFILRQMEIDREGRTTIVMLDACRDNPLARNLARSMGTRSAGIGRGLALPATGLGSFIAFATQPGNVALDGNGRNSPFTTAVLKHMPAQGRSLYSTMIEVRNQVVAATSGQQVPWDHSALTRDFYFVPGDGPAPAQGAATPAPSASSDDLAALKERLRKLEEEARKRDSNSPGTAAQPPAVAAVPPVTAKPDPNASAKSFQASDSVRLDGTELRSFRAPNPDACRNTCAEEAGCIGYQHGRKVPVMGTCTLFSAVTARHEDNKWRSGMRGGGEPPMAKTSFKSGPEHWRRSRTFTFMDGYRTDGPRLKQLHVASSKQCLDACAAESKCEAFQLQDSGAEAGTCRLMTKVTSEVKDAAWLTGLKDIQAATITTAAPARTQAGFDIHDRTMVFGEEINSGSADNAGACLARCAQTTGCVAANYSPEIGDLLLEQVSGCMLLAWIKGTVALGDHTTMIRSGHKP